MKIAINQKEFSVRKGQTIMQICKDNKIFIPSLCHHSDLKDEPNCRICMVEIEGKGFVPACSTEITEGMHIFTESDEIKKIRKTNLELLFAQHQEKCSDCIFSFNCTLLRLAKRYKANISRFKDRKTEYPVKTMGPSLIFDSSKCIDCRNCVEICQKQGVGHLALEKRGDFFEIVETENPCIYCGQCITHCPVGAFEEKGGFEDIEKTLKRKDKFVVFQFAPSIRTSIGEEFDMDYGEVVTEKLVAGIKALGVDKVFDVSIGADFTTKEEAKELIERLEKKENLPMFTSCCPAWVRFIECYYPELIPNLTSVKSPHIILGSLIKEHYASKIDTTNIVVISVMPCVAKKYEITREELKVDGIKPVDYVLTTRELAFLFKKHKINLRKIRNRKPDSSFGIASGAGIIYGASGGVMESSLRTALWELKGKKIAKLEFKEIRGEQGYKEAEIENIKVAVINGIGNAKKMIENNLKQYDYVEVMACFGGCIGGGGQPVPTDKIIREKRAQSLFSIDKKQKIRLAHKNPIIDKVYKTILKNDKKIKQICHTKYFNRKI